MLHNTNRRVQELIAILLVLILAVLITTTTASAAQTKTTTVAANSSCFTCHEDLYYLYDLGNNYCITEHKDRCLNCHEGNPAEMNKDEAHLGLIAHPQKDNGVQCLECHKEETAAYLAKFKSLGGYKQVIEEPPYSPSGKPVAGERLPETSTASPITQNIPFLLGAGLFFGIWLILVFFSPLKP